jgi:oligopeptide/dipeptide ABC transporter ATP-binding protein
MTNVLEVADLKKHFPIRRGVLRKVVGQIKAVDGVDFAIGRGRTLSLVGESGCGKTTVARCIVRALAPTDGAVRFRVGEGPLVDVARLKRVELAPIRPHMQMIFQDPFSSLNPRMMVGDIIAEPMLVNRIGTAQTRRERVRQLLDLVKLPSAYMNRFPHAFSGGQRQRIGIARALALNPSLVVADEPVSALDVSVQAQIVNLLLELQERLGLSYLFVAHDLSVVKHMSDRVAVMYVGRIVEEASAEALFARPRHPYTEALLSAVPKPDPRLRSQRVILKGEVADPAAPPTGCAFHPRCRYAVDRCKVETPRATDIGSSHRVACHRANEIELAGVR